MHNMTELIHLCTRLISEYLKSILNAQVIIGVLAMVCILRPSYGIAEWKVWSIQDSVRVLRDAPAGVGQSVVLAAARNEYESFQILVRSDRPVTGINIKPGDLKGPQGSVIRAKDARLYRQHQLEIIESSFSYNNETFKPGWYPDALIPFRHPVTNQLLRNGRFKAVPFDLPPQQTHGFWIDIYVPKAAKAGKYRGYYLVCANGQPSKKITVALSVWDFALPDTPTMQTALGSPAMRLRTYYADRAKASKELEPTDWNAIENQCAAEVSNHRINATPPAALVTPQHQPDGSWRIPSEELIKLRKFLDRYDVNAVQVARPQSIVKDPEAEHDKLYAWLRAFDQAAAELNRPHVMFYTYLSDEPSSEERYRFVRKWGSAIRAAKSVVKVLVVEQTIPKNEKWGNLYGAVDIWCPLFSLHDEASAARRMAMGEMFWCYTCLESRQPTPRWAIDVPLMNYRVPAWIAWRYGMSGILYWGNMVYWKEVDDPWISPKTYRNKYNAKIVYNGEGTLLYPGRAVGYDGIVPSLRIKALRDGIEDFEYLAILERAGLADEARKVVLPLAESWFKWEKDPAAYRIARAKLADMIIRNKNKLTSYKRQ